MVIKLTICFKWLLGISTSVVAVNVIHVATPIQTNAYIRFCATHDGMKENPNAIHSVVRKGNKICLM